MKIAFKAMFLCLAALLILPPAICRAESSIVVLTVNGDSVRVRSSPHITSPASVILGGVDRGVRLLAERWPVMAGDNEHLWYKIVGYVGSESGYVTGARNAFPGVGTDGRYISAALVRVEPFASDPFSEENLLGQVRRLAYGQGYSLVDSSPQAQKNMVEGGILRSAYPITKHQHLTIFETPSLESPRIAGYLIRDSFDDCTFVVLDSSRDGWLQVVDLTGTSVSGWVQSKDMEVLDRSGDRREMGYQFILNVGANVQEILQRWGPTSEPVKFGAEHSGTVLSFDGMQVRYENVHNFDLVLSRKGAGLGGLFIDTEWCDKKYIHKVFEQALASDSYTPDGGNERLSFQGGPDGWKFWVEVELDDRGLVQKLAFTCGYVIL